MGYEHVDAALESERYQGVKKAVVVGLCKFINAKRAEQGDTEVWPGLKTLCRTAGWGRRAVQRAIDELAADENPVVEVKSQGNGTETTHYIIHVDRLGGVSGTPGVAPLERQGGVSETPRRGLSYAGVVSLVRPKQEENQESKKEGKEEAATAEGAAAVATSTNLTKNEAELLNYWYDHKKIKPDQARINQDLPVLREIISAVGDDTGELLSFVFSDPGEGTWAGWGKKSPNLSALLKHVRKGNLIQQFRSSQETPSSASPLCDACGQEAENFTEFKVTYQTEPRRYCAACVAEGEEQQEVAVAPSVKAKARVASSQEIWEGKVVVVDEL